MRLRGLLAAVVLGSGLPVLVATGAAPAHATAPTTAPALTAPADGVAWTPDSALHWSSVAGAAGYEVQIATDSGFDSVVYDQFTAARTATPPARLPDGVLYWRVRATDATQHSGPASTVRTLVQDPSAAPVPLSPDDGAITAFPDHPPVFAWDAVDGATSYTLQIDDAADFVDPTSITTSNTSYTLTRAQTFDQTYYWRVAATLSNKQSSAYSTVRSYTLSWASTPTLLTPAANSTVTDVVFSWAPVTGASAYNLQVSPNGDFANNVTLQAVNLRSTRYSPASTLDNGSYFWRVQAEDVGSDTGVWSDPLTFNRAWIAPGGDVERPTLLTPQWAPGGDTPYVSAALNLSWTPVHHASSYQIEVSTDPNFSPSPNITFQCVTNHTTFTPYTRLTPSPEYGCKIGGLQPGKIWYWHVRGLDDPYGVDGSWSNVGTDDTWRFIVRPDVPQPLPSADAGLSWTPIAGAAKYLVTIQSGGTNVPGSPWTTYATSFTPPAAVSGAELTWYVQAVDGNGVASAHDSGFPLTLPTSAPASASASVELTAPMDGAVSPRMPQMAWTAPAGASKFEVWYAADGGDFFAFTTTEPYASFTYTGTPLAAGTYTWFVRARDKTGKPLGDSATSSFVISTLPAMPATDYLTPSCVAPTPCDDTPTLSWNPQPNAGWYIVSLAVDPHFTNVLREWGTAYPWLTPRESLVDNQAGQSYYWFVRSCVDVSATRCGPSPQDDVANAAADRFQKRSHPVTGLLPADGTSPVAHQVSLSWDDYLDSTGSVQEAKQYLVQVSTKADFSTVLDTATVDQTTYTAWTRTYPEGPLFWRVQALDGSGNHLTWSTVQTLTKRSPAPVPISPAPAAAVSGVPVLSWSPAPYAANYDVEIYADGDTNFSTVNRVLNVGTWFTYWVPTKGLPSGDYAWRVRPTDADARPGQWSNAGTFTLQGEAPVLVDPADAVAVRSDDLLFSWQPPPSGQKVAQYRWQVSSNAGFSRPVSATTVNHVWAPTGTITDGSWYWRVQVLDGSGDVIATSAVRRFGKDTVAPVVSTWEPNPPVAVGASFRLTFNEPVLHVSGASVVLRVGATGVPARVTASPTTAVLTPLAPLMPGQDYTLAVTAALTDDSGNPIVPTSRSFSVDGHVQHGSPVLVERWAHVATSGASGGGYDLSSTAGASLRWTFTGSRAAVLGTRARDGGYADVYVDGRRTAQASFYSASTANRRTVWSTSSLSSGRHVLELRVLGTHPGAAKGSWVRPDALQAGTAVRQEQDATETFAPSRRGYDLVGHTAGIGSRPTYSLTFRGSSLSVYGLRSPAAGRAAFFLDGRLQDTVDLRSSGTQAQLLLWSSPRLRDGVHHLRIEVVGTATGNGSSVGVSDLRTY